MPVPAGGYFFQCCSAPLVHMISWRNTVELKNDYVLGFIICEIFTVITFQDGVGWGIFTVIPGYPRRTPRITGLAPVRIIYRKKLQDTAFFEIIR